jgi:hypothetical protein
MVIMSSTRVSPAVLALDEVLSTAFLHAGNRIVNAPAGATDWLYRVKIGGRG